MTDDRPKEIYARIGEVESASRASLTMAHNFRVVSGCLKHQQNVRTARSVCYLKGDAGFADLPAGI